MNLPQVPADKAQHFCYGAAVAFAASCATVLIAGRPDLQPLAASGSALAAGIGKEVIDMVLNRSAMVKGLSKPHSASFGDVFATALGGVVVGAF